MGTENKSKVESVVTELLKVSQELIQLVGSGQDNEARRRLLQSNANVLHAAECLTSTLQIIKE